jgi:hypothetical protein
MSDSVRPEVLAFGELETLVRHLGDELAGFRRRALVAEARLRDLDEKDARPSGQVRRELEQRCAVLEHENEALKVRLESATTRTRQVLDRVRFIRQQTQGSAGDR